MSKLEGGGGIRLIPPPSRLRVTIFFFEASRVNCSKNQRISNLFAARTPGWGYSLYSDDTDDRRIF